MKSFSLPKPLSLHYATLSILGGMVLEIIGIAIHSLRHLDGLSGVIIAYAMMIAAAIITVRYAVELEKGKLQKMSSLVIGVLLQVIIIAGLMYFSTVNVFFIAAVVLDLIGTALLFHPRTTWWFREVQHAKNA